MILSSKSPIVVSVIILNWNGEEHLREVIDSVLATRDIPIEIIIVDNSSTDGSTAILKTYANIGLILNKINSGYAGGNNRGIQSARGKYVVTLNNDMAVDPGWLNDPVKIMEEDESVGSASCRQMNYYTRDRIDTLFAFPEKHLLLGRFGHNQQWSNTPILSDPGIVIGPNGGSAIYRKKMLDEIGLFDENFFAYHEECDLSMRAFMAGWKCVYVPSAVVYHKGSATFNKVKKQLYYYHERNRIWFIYKNFPSSIILRNIGTIIVREIRTFIAIAIVRRYPGTYFKARWDGFAGMTRYRKERKKNTAQLVSRKKEFEMLLARKKLPYSR